MTTFPTLTFRPCTSVLSVRTARACTSSLSLDEDKWDEVTTETEKLAVIVLLIGWLEESCTEIGAFSIPED